MTDELVPLQNPEEWTLEWAQALVQAKGLIWSPQLEQQIFAVRQFYSEFGHSPNTRVLIKWLKQFYKTNKK